VRVWGVEFPKLPSFGTPLVGWEASKGFTGDDGGKISITESLLTASQLH
jgi:hypothetical protein